jgi:hypothetical protein
MKTLSALRLLIDEGLRFAKRDDRWMIWGESLMKRSPSRISNRDVMRLAIQRMDEINLVLDGAVCTCCASRLEAHERSGLPICFDCWIEGQEPVDYATLVRPDNS